ncbi:urate hydroxylase PuuD, partial [Rhizobium ruizarguesonis]
RGQAMPVRSGSRRAGYTQLFTGRAAILHLGAFTATIMSANVFMIIIPNQKIVVADLIAGRVPDAVHRLLRRRRPLPGRPARARYQPA